ncbi:MAG: PDZ domain-containing protein [Planctomycetota bacterium]|jgi:hypothetical protein
MKYICFTLSFLLLAAMFFMSPVVSDEGKKKEKEKGYLGVYTEAAADLEQVPGSDAKAGVRIVLVMPHSPAEKAGLLEGDIVVSLDGKALGDNAAEVQGEFSNRMKEFSRGDTVRFVALRQIYTYNVEVDGKKVELEKEKISDLEEYIGRHPAGSEVEISASRNWKIIDFEVELGDRLAGLGIETLRPQAEIHPELKGKETNLEKLSGKLIEHYNIREDCDDLLARLDKTEEKGDPHRLEQVTYVHRDVFRMEAVTEDIVSRVSGHGTASAALLRFLSSASYLLDVNVRIPRSGRLRSGIEPKEHLDQLEELLEKAAAFRKQAFREFTPEEEKFLFANIEPLGDKLNEHIYVHLEEDREKKAKHFRIIELARKVDYEALLKSAATIRPLTDKTWLKALAKDFKKAGKYNGGIVAERRTPSGMIFIGGAADHWYKDKDAAIIIDFAGRDFYTQNSGSSTRGIPVSVIVDMQGDDAYESCKPFSIGSGLLGIGMIYDAEGDDSYIGIKLCQAFAALGIGLVMDEKGNDVYRILYLGQGAAMWGAGAIIDLAGNDRYEAHKFAQGLGMPHGFGALIDARGDDYYYGKGSQASGYGTPGIFEGSCQGFGLGFRTLASGGIGLLVDGAGKDRYEAGLFSQGGGYYFAWGIMVDRGDDNDYYLGSRYAQGFSAHQAAGTFIEEGGDDYYGTRNSVHAGLAWDECVTLFIDRGGNDTYYRGGFSLGASAHNAICIFIDAGGKDDYLYGGKIGRSGSNKYHGGTSLSLFLDLGGDKDAYKDKGAANNEIVYRKEHGIVCDLPGTIADALRSDKFRELIREKKEK